MIPIGKMARYCQTSVQTLRLYDKAGILKPIHIDPDSHYRYYEAGQIFQFNLIKYLQSSNLSLQEIKTILSENTINLEDFWKGQELKIREQLEETRRKLMLARFQKRQAQSLMIMKDHINQKPYKKEIKKIIALIPAKSVWGPDDIPDPLVSELNKELLANHQIPNLEYGFTFSYISNPAKLTDIRYTTAFKELIISDPSIKSDSLSVEDVSGTYLCINFMWSRPAYLSYLGELLAAAGYPQNAVIYEESFPLSYYNNEFIHGEQALTELRVKI